jgi:hypothetical protein
MSRIHRTVRTIAVAIVSALLVACGSDEATAPRQDVPPDTEQPAPPPIVGAWVTQQLDGKAMPALFNSGTMPDGWSWELRVLSDSLIITADGRWVQRVRVEETNTKGETYRYSYNDRGWWTRQGDVVHFDSNWIENVSFDGELTPDGLVVTHDFTLDDDLAPMRRDMKR